jgi:hypothetical protein
MVNFNKKAADYKDKFNKIQNSKKKTVFGTGRNSETDKSGMGENSEATENSKIEAHFGIKRRFDQSAEITINDKASRKSDSSNSSSSGGVFIDPPKHIDPDELNHMNSLKGN